jgi:hypothetical protein
MKRTIKLILITAMLAAFTVPVLAQSKDCTDENKAAWYQKFLDNYKGNPDQQKVAYDNANLYLACSSDASDQIATYLKKFVDAYNKVRGNQEIGKQFEEAYKQNKYADQMRLGKQILASTPDDATQTKITIFLGVAGLGDPSVLNDSVDYAKKAIALIESGKSPEPYTKDQALAYLNWTLAKASLANAPADAIPYLVKAAKFNSDVSKKPELYLDLAAAYATGPRAKLTDEYKAKLNPDQTENDTSKLVLENLNQVIDRQIDAMARAAALTTDAAKKKAIMDELTTDYKYRTKSETGLNEMVASVLSKPLPDMPTPITQLPTPTPTSTPGGAPATSSSSTAATGNTKPATGTSGTSTGAQKPAATGTAKPTPTPSPNRKPRTNYRRG